MDVLVIVSEPVFEFYSFENWVNKAQSRYAECGVSSCDLVAIDSAGNICTRGIHFMRARDKKTFPVTVYAVDEPEADTPLTLQGKE